MNDHKPMPVLDDRSPQPDEPRHSHAPAEDTPTPTSGAELDAGVPSQSTEAAVSIDQVKLALRRVKDPELNLNILDLGLVYAIDTEGSKVKIDMSLTSPGCPSGPEIMTNAEQAIRALPGVTDVVVNLVWSPFWTPDRIEPRIRAYLGI